VTVKYTKCDDDNDDDDDDDDVFFRVRIHNNATQHCYGTTEFNLL